MKRQNKINKDQIPNQFDVSFKVLAEVSPSGIYLTDSTGKCFYVNQAWCSMSGFTFEESVGDGWMEAIHSEDRVRIHSEWENFISGEIPWVSEYRLLDKKANIIWVHSVATLFRNEDGKVQGVFAAARDITDHKKMEVELRNSKELLEKLNLHLQEIRENERSQIALNLHDDLGQRLTALYLDVAWLKSRIGVQSLAIRKKMEEISQLINETIEGIKEFSSFLRPAILFDLGLVPAINEQLGKFKKQTGIICLFYCEPEEFIIDDRLALVLYRILQEALTNISRHAGASTTEINLRVLKNTIVMVIKDDGIGIDQDKINSLTSMGIAGIKERLKSVNGRVLIEGEKGVGTIMKVLIPLKKREES
jgi:PAS domain S-box-containing protein